MNDKKHIDRLFQEKFKNFEVAPDASVWDTIHNALHDDKPRRRVIPVWWFAAGVAAILVLLLTVGTVFNNNDGFTNPDIKVVDIETTRGSSESNKSTSDNENNNEGSNVIANTDSSEVADVNFKNDIDKKAVNRKDKTATQIANENSDKSNTTELNSEKEIEASLENKSVITNPKEEAVAKNTRNLLQLNSNKEVIGQNSDGGKTNLQSDEELTKIAKLAEENTLKNKDTIISNTGIESIEGAIAKAYPTNEEEKEEQPNRWNITPNVAPVYFNSLGKGSSIDNQFVNNGKSGAVNMSYGINGSYAINDKIKIRAGVNKVDLGYSTDGVVAFKDMHSFNANSDSGALRNINLNSQGRADAYMSTSSINSTSAPEFVVSNVNGSLEQQFGYIEVPLEVEYNILNNKFGLNVIGGFSTLFLNNNEIYSVLDSERLLLGDANNINSTSYSANFGLGFNYNVSHTLKLNLEPMFKYQINTFSNTSGDFRPYFIGLYTGFSFKF